MKYQVIGTLKVRTTSGVRELKSGDMVALPEYMALRLIAGGRVKPLSPDCFSPDGTLEAAFMEAKADGWTDDRFGEYIDALREAGALQASWGFKVKDSSFIDDFWIVSDETAKGMLPAMAKSLTIDELRPIVEAFRVFPGAKLVRMTV